MRESCHIRQIIFSILLLNILKLYESDENDKVTSRMRLSARCTTIAIASLLRLQKDSSLLLLSNFSKLLGKSLYFKFIKRMYNVIYAYIEIVKSEFCLY